MDAGLAWTVAGSAAGVAGAVLAGVQVWQSCRRPAAAAPAGAPRGLPGGGQVSVTGGQGTQVGTGNIQVNVSAPPPRPAAGLVVVGEIPREPPGWQPRPGLLAAVRDLGPGSRVVVAAVTGMRGVGKTQVAAACARARLGEPGWRLVAWVNAETPASLLAGLADTAEAVGLAAADGAAAGRAVRRWLEAGGTGCLLVLDNVTDPDAAAPFLPAGGNARVIVTTTLRDADGLGTVIDVAVFTPGEGLAYLAHRTGLADQAGAAELGGELGWLPLALAQAAAVITARRLGYAGYLALLRAVPVTGLLAPVPAGQYPRGAAAAILLSLAAVTGADPGGTCGQVMELLAVLSPAGVPRALVRAAAGHAEPQDGPGAPPAAGAADADAALGRLAAASLLSLSVDGSTVIAHRLVQRAVRDQLTQSGRLAGACQAAARAISASAASLAAARHLDRAAARDLAGQATALHQAAAAASGDDDLTRAIIGARVWALYFLGELGDSAAQAIALGEDLAADAERILGPDHPGTLASRGNLASSYRAAGAPPRPPPWTSRPWPPASGPWDPTTPTP